MTISWNELQGLCVRALRSAGMDEQSAVSLSQASIDAERRGRSNVGVGHIFDYIAAVREGRLNPNPQVTVSAPRAAILSVDADRGTAQLAYDLAREQFLAAVRHTGMAMLGIGRSYTSGELGFYSSDIASEGLIAMTGTNSPPLMSVFGAPTPVTGTNPFSFALPGAPSPRVVDQASSEIAWVSIREAADKGEAIPEGWALGPDGEPTTDAHAALAGALLPFGGFKGSNIAVVIELLSALAGGRFSLDAPSHYEGNACPEVGTWVIAIDPESFDPGFIARADAHFARLSEFIGHDFGRRRPLLSEPAVAEDLLTRLRDAAASAA